MPESIEKAINLVKSLNYTILPCDINKSNTSWSIDPNDNNCLLQPLNSLKGLGEKAIFEILNNRPFNKIEDLLFNENISYMKLNKKGLDVLCRSGALNSLMDNRFNNQKHFWFSVALDRPKTEKDFLENIEKYANEPDFDKNEIIENLTTLTGIFPLELIFDHRLKRELDNKCIPPVSQFDLELKVAWCIVRSVEYKKTRNGKDYLIVQVIDDTFTTTTIRCWGINIEKDRLFVNRVYGIAPEYNEQYGLSTRGAISRSWRLLT